MRIVSGKLKSFRFNPPKGFPSRPTTNFAKEALFNVLQHRIAMYDLDILDLYAGTGNISFEFASREAGYIDAVDNNFKCCKFIQTLALKYKVEDEVNVIKSDAIKFLNTSHKTYDLIFCDPPFKMDVHEEIIEIIKERKLLNENGLLIIEHGRETNLSKIKGFNDAKNYGGVIFSFFTFE